MIRFFSRQSLLGFAALFSMMCVSHTMQAQNIAAGNLSLDIGGAYVLNGEGNSTGSSVAAGTTLTGFVSVDGVGGPGGTVTVSCGDYFTGGTIFTWSTERAAGVSFTWTPTTAGIHQLYCSGTWRSAHVNGTVTTGTAYIPVT